MNVREFNTNSPETLDRYVGVTIGLTLFTFYIVIAVQKHTSFHERGARLRDRAAWPILYPKRLAQETRRSGVKQQRVSAEETPRRADTSPGIEMNERRNPV